MQRFSVRRLRLAGFIVGRGGTRSSFGEQRFQCPDDGGEDDGPDGGLPFVLDCGNEHPNGEGQKQDGGQGVERHTEGAFGFGLAPAQNQHAGDGRVIVEIAEPAFKRTIDVWGPTPPGFGLMEELKRRFDPDGVFSPGRSVGRL